MRLTRLRIGFRFGGGGPSYSPKCGWSVCGCKAWCSFANRPGSTFAIMASPCSVPRTRTPRAAPVVATPAPGHHTHKHTIHRKSPGRAEAIAAGTSGRAETQPPGPSAIAVARGPVIGTRRRDVRLRRRGFRLEYASMASMTGHPDMADLDRRAVRRDRRGPAAYVRARLRSLRTQNPSRGRF